MPANRIDAAITPDQHARAQAALTALTDALPFLIDLADGERTAMVKFGEMNRSFVVKALAIAEAQPEILPSGFSLPEFAADVALVEDLYPVRHRLETVFRKLDDTYFAAGSEAYAAALLVYQYAKLHNLSTGALEGSLDDLGRRFARKTRKAAPTP